MITRQYYCNLVRSVCVAVQLSPSPSVVPRGTAPPPTALDTFLLLQPQLLPDSSLSHAPHAAAPPLCAVLPYSIFAVRGRHVVTALLFPVAMAC